MSRLTVPRGLLRGRINAGSLSDVAEDECVLSDREEGVDPGRGPPERSSGVQSKGGGEAAERRAQARELETALGSHTAAHLPALVQSPGFITC